LDQLPPSPGRCRHLSIDSVRQVPLKLVSNGRTSEGR